MTTTPPNTPQKSPTPELDGQVESHPGYTWKKHDQLTPGGAPGVHCTVKAIEPEKKQYFIDVPGKDDWIAVPKDELEKSWHLSDKDERADEDEQRNPHEAGDPDFDDDGFPTFRSDQP